MNITELHNLYAAEKLKIIEALWGDLVGDENSLPNLEWHETKLKETEQKFLADNIEVLDWEQVKNELRSQFEQSPNFPFSSHERPRGSLLRATSLSLSTDLVFLLIMETEVL